MIPYIGIFLKEILDALNFPSQFIQWIMLCVSTPKYSVMVNGTLHGYFEGKRGLRQGDPVSPLLFLICMEYFTIVLNEVG